MKPKKMPPKQKCREAMILARNAHSAHKALQSFPEDGDAEVRRGLELLCLMQLSNRNRSLAVR